MSKLYFMNNGYFDIRAMMTFGVNVKETDNPIGFFGTGFKYAVAIILRHSGTITVSTKTPDGTVKLIKFTKHTETIRGKEFDLVKMNGQDMGMTTHHGINWEPWQAYRELFSNCVDEGGIVDDVLVAGYETVVTVECQDIYKAWSEKSKYFIDGEPIHTGEGIEIYKGDRAFFYYHGIAISNADSDCMFSYNVTRSLELTEDRTAKYPHVIPSRIAKCYLSMKDEDLLESVLEAKDKFESSLDFDCYMTPTEEFLEVASRLKKTGRGVNDSVRELLNKHRKSKGEYPGRPLSPVEQKMLGKAIMFLKGINIDVDKYEILTVSGMGDGIMGRAMKDKIYLSNLPFDMGTKQVASTLLEEWVHLKYNCGDFTRPMQNWLFDKILSIGEQINGEPL